MIVDFKSNPEMYEKEESGKKPNTVRKWEFGDDRFQHLLYGKAKKVRITNTKTGDFFIRDITDYSMWNDISIISWKHKEDKVSR